MSRNPKQVGVRRLKTLNKRLEYLEQRIAEGEAKGQNFAYDKAEAGAVRWAITVIEKHWFNAVDEIKFEAPSEENDEEKI